MGVSSATMNKGTFHVTTPSDEEIKAMLVGQSVEPERQRAMRKFIEERPEVGHVISLITLQLGNDVMVSVQAEMREGQSAIALVEQINDVERAMKLEFPDIRWSFFEPDLVPVVT